MVKIILKGAKTENLLEIVQFKDILGKFSDSFFPTGGGKKVRVRGGGLYVVPPVPPPVIPMIYYLEMSRHFFQISDI